MSKINHGEMIDDVNSTPAEKLKEVIEAMKLMVQSWERRPNFLPQIDLSIDEQYLYYVLEKNYPAKK
jgi:hypothetical protein